jgi:hypothetical protein
LRTLLIEISNGRKLSVRKLLQDESAIYLFSGGNKTIKLKHSGWKKSLECEGPGMMDSCGV